MPHAIMIFSANKSCTRLLIVLQLIFFSLSTSTPLLHAHDFGHGSDKHHSHGLLGAHFAVDHVDDHDHEDSTLGEENLFATDFHTHNSKTHTHLIKDIRSIICVNKRPGQNISLFARNFSTHYKPIEKIQIENFHVLYNPPLYRDKTVVLSFTSLPPPQA